MKFKILCLVAVLASFMRTPGQSLIPSGEIGSFAGAMSFAVSPSGFIYVADSSSNELIKLDFTGKAVKTIGGFGWQQSAFDNPVHVSATALNVYVSDKNNNRIQYFDKDLNYLSEFSTQNATDTRYLFNYPVCSAVSNQGDLFILDSDNKRILKFNLRGEFQCVIGSFDAGSFALSHPLNFAITGGGNLIVTDPPSVTEFDQYGNGIRKIALPASPVKVNTLLKGITFSNKSQIMLLNDEDLELGLFKPIVLAPDIGEEITDACVLNNQLFVLTRTRIVMYNIVR
jgi:DNA-binding beta-propeller fold protein YncE